MRFCSDEPLDVLLNPHREEEQDRARAAGAERLQALGLRLTGTESVEEIGELVDAVERFEEAVESRGGDLMVDEAPRGEATEPDRGDFVLPARGADEAVAPYVGRIVEAARHLRHTPAID